jgi:L-2-hydroxyglutarate oxidase
MGNSRDYDVAVIGGGIVGLAVAYRIVTRHPAASASWRKSLASHQTATTRAPSRSLQVRLETGCARRTAELIEFARDHGVPFGSAARSSWRLSNASCPHAVLDYAGANGVGASRRSAPGEREIATAGHLRPYVPGTGIIDFTQVAGPRGAHKTRVDNRILMGQEV